MSPSSYLPGEALVGRIVEVLRASDYMETLLFPDWAPRLSGDDSDFDDRVWTAAADLPESPAVRSQLPRILIESQWAPSQYEQDGDTLQGSVSLQVHILVPKDQEEYGGYIVAAIISLLLSTQLSDPRIIAAGLYLTDQQRPKQRISAFTGAWEYMVQFRSANVGVLT